MKFTELEGLTLSDVDIGSDEVTLKTTCGRNFRLYHCQDCCESVRVVETEGNIKDIVGSPLIEVSDTGYEPLSFSNHKYYDSYTWSCFTFVTEKGKVSIYWLGESNGYYSEGVDFNEF